MTTKREVLEYLPHSGRELFVVMTEYLDVQSFVPERMLSDLYSALIAAGGEAIATGNKKIPCHEVKEVVALVRVRYTEDSDTSIRIEPLLVDDVNSDADTEVPEISHTTYWSLYASRADADQVVLRGNITWETTLEIAKKVIGSNT